MANGQGRRPAAATTPSGNLPANFHEEVTVDSTTAAIRRPPKPFSEDPVIDAQTIVYRTDRAHPAADPAARGAASSLGEVHVASTPLVEPASSERYATRSILGQGGMGEVLLCRDNRIGRDVALKVVRQDRGVGAEMRARFEREARIQGQLEHPAVLPVYDLGLDHQGAAFFTMKRARGRTFEDIIEGIWQRRSDFVRTYSRRRLLTAFSQVCLAVEYAHSRGVLHRDIKPANVMLGDFGEVHLLDWGLACVRSDPEPARSRTSVDQSPMSRHAVDAPLAPEAQTLAGDILGTPGYMAPEQILCEAVDARTDVYALGAVLYELLTLEPLHPRGPNEQVFASTLKGKQSPASERTPERAIPPELDAICVKACASAAADRYPTARSLHEAIEAFLDGDRDVEKRRELAEKHAIAARTALEGEVTEAARSRALREAGAAVALAPDHAQALAILSRLLLEGPATMPPEARVEFEAQKAPATRTRRKGTVWTSMTLPLFALLLLALGVRNTTLAIVNVVLAIACPLVALRSTLLPPTRHIGPWLLLAGFTSIASFTLVMGPLVLVPTLAAATAATWVAISDPSLRAKAIIGGVLATIVPVGLTVAGVLPAPYAFENGAMRVLPNMTELPYLPTMGFLLVTSLTSIIAPALLIWRVRDALGVAEERVFLHAWRLRRMVPEELR